MKRFIVLIAAALVLVPGLNRVSAQGKYGADSAECIKYLSYYQEYFKQKNYTDALPNWRKAYKICPPTANQNMLINGTALMRQLIGKNSKNPIYKEALVDTLMTIHDTRAQYYPKYAVTALNNKGLDMNLYIKDNPKKLYEGYSEIIKKNGVNIKPQILLFNLNAAIDLYHNGVLDAETVIEEYENAANILSQIQPKNQADTDMIAKINEDVENLFISSKVASVDALVELFAPRMQSDPDNLALAQNVVKILSITEGGVDTDLFLEAVNTMNRLDPSYTSAYYLFKLHSSRGDVNEAIKYMEEAIAYPESDEATDASYNYELAVYCFKNGHNAKSFACAKNAAKNEVYAGKANLLMGQIWGSLVCKGNEIEVRAPYWVAVDYMIKAKNADPSLAEEANSYIAQYSKYFPQAADAFMYGAQDGNPYTVSCSGLTATTTVRTQR